MTRQAQWRVSWQAVRQLGPWLALGIVVAGGALAQEDPAQVGSGSAPDGEVAAETATESASEPGDAAASESSDAAALDSFDRTPQRCIQLRRIDYTEVLDEQTILFHMYGSAIYRNYLPEQCRGLNDREPFAYDTRSVSRELCANDMIDLLHGVGTNLWRGRSCRLGMFHPATPEEVEEIKNLPARSGIAVEPVPGPEEIGEPESPAPEDTGDSEPPASAEGQVAPTTPTE